MIPKVSIIVPIYNVKNYLGRCLDSLLSQRLKEIEVIAVNDGSTDGSLKILEEYALRDNRIVVIDKQNGGVSSARNVGLEVAKGNFLGFVDPDDWTEADMYEQLYQTAIQENADIVMCTYTREFGTHSKIKDFQLPKKAIYEYEKVRSELLRRLIGPLNEEMSRPELLDAWGTVWSKLYRADVIKKNGIEFVDLERIGTNEDSLFNIHTFYHTKKFVFLNKPLYHYWRANTGSLTSGYNPQLKEQWFNLYRLIEEFLNKHNLQEDFYLALNNRICLNTLGLGLNTVSKSNKGSTFRKIKKLQSILGDQYIQNSFKRFEMTYFSFVWRAFYFCAKSRFATGFYIMLLSLDWMRKMIR